MLVHSFKRYRHQFILVLLTLAMVLPGLANLPVIDRDEARYAQASVQMAESGDFLNIRYQDKARHKKPVGVYWAQTAMIKIFSQDGERRIWAQRLPSVLGALVSILALYWGGHRMIGREATFFGAALLATSFIFVFEGHIAKTDALLFASTTVMFAALGRLRNDAGRTEVWAFWIALGLSILIKGPVGLALVVFSLATIGIWERTLRWVKPLLNWPAILVFLLIWTPWSIAIFIATEGAFFAESLGNDLAAKITSAQESHGAPPGTHSALIWITLWPACFFLVPGIVHTSYVLRKFKDEKAAISIVPDIRFMVAWSLPFWILIELMPTKLPHYGLPVFPAICLMMGASIVAMKHSGGFRKSRVIGGVLFVIVTSLILGILLIGHADYAPEDSPAVIYVITTLGAILAILAITALWRSKFRLAFNAVTATAVITMGGAYQYALPKIDAFNTSKRLAIAAKSFAPKANSEDFHSPHYAEPSFVYHIGKNVNLIGESPSFENHKFIILDMYAESAADIWRDLERQSSKQDLCLTPSVPVTGFNYSNGIEVNLVILKQMPC